MKKIITSVLLLSMACGLWATPKGTSPQVNAKLERAVSTAVQRKLTWQEQLRFMQAQFDKVGNTAVVFSAPAVFKTDLNPSKNKRYMQRLFELQEKINTHPNLKGYRFAAPVPADLAALSDDNYEALYAFFQNLPTARVTRTQWAHPFTLSLRIEGLEAGTVELWIDEPTQSIYLMSDNLFTTASGKYAAEQLEK